jgi:Mlc titration factor MtfA (ptsG expression regulator)
MNPFAAFRQWRAARTLARRPIPDALWQQTLHDFPFLAWRAPARRERLRHMATLFLADKEFAGAHGLEVTDAMATAIAAQACVPVLALGLDWYDGFKGIVVHADAVRARRQVTDDIGLVHEYDEDLSGEAMQDGPVMLSWHDVAIAGASADTAYNVVIHEFAHVLDMRDGSADGIPPLPASLQAHWARVIDAQWQRFCRRVDAGEPTLVDPYGAAGPEEFFAVASEAFFVAPAAFAAEEGVLHELLQRFYRQDPAADHAAYATKAL